jgi:hypothetical protein
VFFLRILHFVFLSVLLQPVLSVGQGQLYASCTRPLPAIFRQLQRSETRRFKVNRICPVSVMSIARDSSFTDDSTGRLADFYFVSPTHPYPGRDQPAFAYRNLTARPTHQLVAPSRVFPDDSDSGLRTPARVVI